MFFLFTAVQAFALYLLLLRSDYEGYFAVYAVLQASFDGAFGQVEAHKNLGFHLLRLGFVFSAAVLPGAFSKSFDASYLVYFGLSELILTIVHFVWYREARQDLAKVCFLEGDASWGNFNPSARFFAVVVFSFVAAALLLPLADLLTGAWRPDAFSVITCVGMPVVFFSGVRSLPTFREVGKDLPGGTFSGLIQALWMGSILIALEIAALVLLWQSPFLVFIAFFLIFLSGRSFGF